MVTTSGLKPSSSSSSRTSAVMRVPASACPVTILPKRMLSCRVAALLYCVGDEGVVREERVALRQAAEELDHRLGGLVAGAQQELLEARVVQHLAHLGVGREVLDLESFADRRAVQQVLGEGRVAVVLVGV